MHAGAALVGFGSVALSGFYAVRLDTAQFEESVRYFTSKRQLARSFVYVTGALGVVLLVLNQASKAISGDTWLRISVADYLLLVLYVTVSIWPLERKIRLALLDGFARDAAVITGPSKSLIRRSLVVDVMSIVALTLMVTQPGH